MMKNNLSILIVSQNEDRHSLFSSYISEFLPDASIISCDSIKNAENAALGNLPVIIFCDEYVAGVSSQILYENLRTYQHKSTIYFIVVTDKSDHTQLKKFIENGYDDYLIGDKNKSMILNRLRIGERNINLQLEILKENEQLKKLKTKLESELDGIKKLSVKLIESKIPSARNMISKIADIAIWIAKNLKEFSEEELFNIEVAAYYSQVGRLFLPNKILMLPVMSNGAVLHEEMYSVPVSAKEILGSMEVFEDASKIAYHIWENFDGSGMPAKLQKWQIPIESRIIRVAIDYEENRYFRDLSPQKTIETLKSRINRLYDPKIISLLEQYKANSNDLSVHTNDIPIRVKELEPGMVLSRDLNTSNGLKMLGAGTELTEKNIGFIKNRTSSDPIFGYIYVEKSFLKKKLNIN